MNCHLAVESLTKAYQYSFVKLEKLATAKITPQKLFAGDFIESDQMKLTYSGASSPEQI